MIQIFITGGTFDKSYNYIDVELFFKKTHLPEMLERSRCKLDIEVETLMMIDSLKMSTADRNYALAHFMRETNNIKKIGFPINTKLNETMELYFQCCFLQFTMKEI